MIPLSSTGRSLLIAGALVLALTACGRRGPLEQPPAAQSPAVSGQTAQASSGTPAPGIEGSSDDLETATPSLLPSANPTPQKRGRRGAVVPKEPFILDPLL
jgi:predicted small lipoprotein YifL